VNSIHTIEELSANIASGIACALSQTVADGVPHLRPFSVTDDCRLVISSAPRIPAAAIPSNKMGFQKGDILFNNTNSIELVGKSAIFSSPLEASFSNHMTRVRIDLSKAEPGYVHAYLRHLYNRRFFQDRATRWIGQAAFGTAQLKALEVPYPPLDEQRRIVSFLDRAAHITRRANAARAKARAIIPALFYESFGDPATNPKGWPTLTLGEAISFGPQNGLYKPATYYGAGVRILRIDSFDDGAITNQAALKRLRIDPETLEKFRLEEDDVVINRVNSPPQLGKSIVVPRLEEPVVYESNMMRLRVNSALLAPPFLGAMLQLNSVRQALTKNAKHAINQSSINQGDVAGIRLITPPMSLQATFAEQVRRLETLGCRLDAAAAKAEAAAASLSAEVFDQAPQNGSDHVDARVSAPSLVEKATGNVAF
jgi:type I restriction enzyme, S subunit